MSDIIYTKTIQADTITGANCIQLFAPSRGELKKVIITPPSGGGAVITNAVVYDRQDACDGEARSVNPDDGNPHGLNPIVHQITPTLTPTGNVIAEYEKAWVYENQDEQVVTSKSRSRIWLSLNMATGGVVHIAYSISVTDF